MNLRVYRIHPGHSMIKGRTVPMSPYPYRNGPVPRLIALIMAALVIIPASLHAQEEALPDRIITLDRSTRAYEGEHTPLNFDTHHPQGMTRVGERWFMTSVESIDRAKGIGKGYLFEFTDQGKLLRTLELGDGPMYHPGGIDFDGKHIWVCVAEYRPDSNSVIYRVDPDTLGYEEVFRFHDHLGGIVAIPTRNELIAVSWGSRRFYKWKTDTKGNVINPDKPLMQRNPSHFIDYQDGQWIKGTDFLIMGGLASYKLDPDRGGSASVGGIALINAETLSPVAELPIQLYSQKGRVLNQNPFYLVQHEHGIELYSVPDDNESTLYNYTFRTRTRTDK